VIGQAYSLVMKKQRENARNCFRQWVATNVEDGHEKSKFSTNSLRYLQVKQSRQHTDALAKKNPT